MKSSVRATRRNARSAAPAGIPGAVATRQSGDLAFGEAHWRATLLRNPSDPLAPRALSDIAHQSGRYGEAAKRLGPIAEGPADFSNLGISLAELGQDDAAETAYRRAIALDPKCAAAHFNLGNLLHKQQRNAEAEKAFRAALSIRTDYSKAWNGLGQSLQCQGRLNELLSAFRTAVRYDPACTAAHCNIGTILFALDHNAEALIAFRRALTLDPGHALAHGNIGALLARSGWPIAAELASRTAISLAPDQHCWLTNLGVALLAQGRYAEAEACYRKALAMRPDYAVGHGNLLFALNYRTDVTEEAVFAECDAWDRRHARHLAPTTPNYTLDRTPGRRLRVGYVSADFRQHAVAMFAEPLIAAHERSKVELYLYSGVAAEDAETDRFRSLSDHWRSTIGLSDAELAEQSAATRSMCWSISLATARATVC